MGFPGKRRGERLEEALPVKESNVRVLKPAWLKDITGACVVWDELIAAMSYKLEPQDVPAFSDLCVCIARLRAEEKQIQREVLQVARQKFGEDQKKAELQSKSILFFFNKLLQNIDLARSSFRAIPDKRVRNQWLGEAAKVFTKEIVQASDLSTQRSFQAWFEKFVDMVVKIRNKVRVDKTLGQPIFSQMGQVFSTVLNQTKKVKTFGAPDERYDRNLRLVRSKFIGRSAEQKAINSPIRKMLEQKAQILYRLETK